MMGNDLSQFPPHQHPNNQQQSNESNMQFPSDTPNMPFGPNSQHNNKMGNFMDQKPGDVRGIIYVDSFINSKIFSCRWETMVHLNLHLAVDDQICP